MTIDTFVVGPIATNCYILTDDDTGKSIIIDPGDSSPQIYNAIKKIGCENIEAIILTHGHFDHINGLPLVKELTGAPIYVHEADADFLRADGANPRGCLRDEVNYIPDMLLKDKQTITLGNLTLHILHTPGHTPGSCCIMCEDTIFSGDTLFYHNIGRADFAYSDFQAELNSIERLKNLPGNYTILPGHDRPTTLNDERIHNPYMKR